MAARSRSESPGGLVGEQVGHGLSGSVKIRGGSSSIPGNFAGEACMPAEFATNQRWTKSPGKWVKGGGTWERIVAPQTGIRPRSHPRGMPTCFRFAHLTSAIARSHTPPGLASVAGGCYIWLGGPEAMPLQGQALGERPPVAGLRARRRKLRWR